MFLSFISKYAMLGLGIALALALAWGGYEKYEVTRAALAMQEHLKLDAEAQAAAEAQGKALGERVTKAVNEAAGSYEQGKKDAQTNQSNLFADLNAANKRLRSTWSCQGPAVSVPADAAATVGPGPAERDRNESASRIIGAADTCDAQVTALQKAYNDAMTLINGVHR